MNKINADAVMWGSLYLRHENTQSIGVFSEILMIQENNKKKEGMIDG